MTSVTPKAVTFTNGTANDATQVDSEITNLFNNDSTLATALTTVEGDYITRVALKTFIQGLRPSWASTSTITVPVGRIIDNSQSSFITLSASKTLNMASTGLNGLAQSSALTGTIAVSSGSATVTGTSTTFTSDFQVGDVIVTAGGQGRRITVIGSNTSITVESNFSSNESGVTYKRGGEAPSTHYYIYIISDGATPGVIGSTRNLANGTDTLADLPSGYTKYRQLPMSFRNNSSSNIIDFSIMDGWPHNPYIQYNTQFSYINTTVGETNVLDGGTATSFTDVDLSAYVPPIATKAEIKYGLLYVSAAGNLDLRKNGSSSGGYQVYVDSSYLINEGHVKISTDASQVIEYALSSANKVVDLAVMGYVVTEVV